MSSARNRNKFCLSLDNVSSNTTSGSTVQLNRWSEVVPPKTALTFAALWDPQDGMVTFSGAALLETDGPPEMMPPHPDVFDDEDLSQFISVDRDTTHENTATLATFEDALKAILQHTPWDSRDHLHATKSGRATPCCLRTRASSTFDGLDIYSHDVQLKPKKSLQPSCIDLLDIETSFRAPSAFGRLRLRSDLKLDAYCSESDKDSITANRLSCLVKSRFSTTTTSTSNYVDVPLHPCPSSSTTATATPQGIALKESISPANSWPFFPRRRRVLRKRRRPLDGGDAITLSGATDSHPSTPRKVGRKSSMSLYPFSLSSTSTSVSSSESSNASGSGEERRGRIFRTPLRPMHSPTSSDMQTCSSMRTPPVTPTASPSKSLRLGLRFSFLPRRKSRQPSPDSDGWVLIEITPLIRQRFVEDLDDDE